jgi:hypothetical protein
MRSAAIDRLRIPYKRRTVLSKLLELNGLLWEHRVPNPIPKPFLHQDTGVLSGYSVRAVSRRMGAAIPCYALMVYVTHGATRP